MSVCLRPIRAGMLAMVVCLLQVGVGRAEAASPERLQRFATLLRQLRGGMAEDEFGRFPARAPGVQSPAIRSKCA